MDVVSIARPVPHMAVAELALPSASTLNWRPRLASTANAPTAITSRARMITGPGHEKRPSAIRPTRPVASSSRSASGSAMRPKRVRASSRRARLPSTTSVIPIAPKQTPARIDVGPGSTATKYASTGRPRIRRTVIALGSQRRRLIATPRQVLRSVGARGFEPPTARPPAGCATRLRHAPWPCPGYHRALPRPSASQRKLVPDPADRRRRALEGDLTLLAAAADLHLDRAVRQRPLADRDAQRAAEQLGLDELLAGRHPLAVVVEHLEPGLPQLVDEAVRELGLRRARIADQHEVDVEGRHGL